MSLSDIMGRMDLATYPEVGLVLFLLVFVAVTWRVLRGSRAEMARHAAMILDDDTEASKP